MSRYEKNCSTNLYKDFTTKSSLIKLIKFETQDFLKSIFI